jgi:SAM-dependent methyltransferase
MPMTATSYRESHLAKGEDFHREFDVKVNARRGMIWKFEQEIINKILDEFLATTPIHHLDFACGTGRLLHFLEGRTKESVGIDVSSRMLEVAKKITSKSIIIHGDMTHSPLLDERFNLITAFRFFPNAEPELRATAMRVLARHLRPNGILVFNNHIHWHSLYKRIVRVCSFGLRKGGYHGMRSSEVLAMITDACLRIRRVYHVGVLPEFGPIPLRPRRLVEAIEAKAMHVPLSSVAEDLIYVCSL